MKRAIMVSMGCLLLAGCVVSTEEEDVGDAQAAAQAAEEENAGDPSHTVEKLGPTEVATPVGYMRPDPAWAMAPGKIALPSKATKGCPDCCAPRPSGAESQGMAVWVECPREVPLRDYLGTE